MVATGANCGVESGRADSWRFWFWALLVAAGLWARWSASAVLSGALSAVFEFFLVGVVLIRKSCQRARLWGNVDLRGWGGFSGFVPPCPALFLVRLCSVFGGRLG